MCWKETEEEKHPIRQGQEGPCWARRNWSRSPACDSPIKGVVKAESNTLQTLPIDLRRGSRKLAGKGDGDGTADVGERSDACMQQFTKQSPAGETHFFGKSRVFRSVLGGTSNGGWERSRESCRLACASVRTGMSSTAGTRPSSDDGDAHALGSSGGAETDTKSGRFAGDFECFTDMVEERLGSKPEGGVTVSSTLVGIALPLCA
jgi:hypothetical protein